jgi:hypothetical protein
MKPCDTILPMRRLFLILFPVLLSAQVTMTLTGPATAKAGSSVTVTLSASGTPDTGAAGLQWKVNYPASSYTATNVVGAQAVAASKGLVCTSDKSLCLLYGLNATVLANGEMAVYTLSIPANAPPGPVTVGLTGLVAASPTGVSIPVTAGAAYVLTIGDKRDIDGSGTVDNADVLLMATQAVQSSTNPAACVNDQNGDGKCDLIDVFAVLLKALGLVP